MEVITQVVRCTAALGARQGADTDGKTLKNDVYLGENRQRNSHRRRKTGVTLS